MPADNLHGFRPDTIALLRQLNSGFWRLPGGNFELTDERGLGVHPHISRIPGVHREPNAGVCLDAFHFYKGPSKSEDLERLTTANLFHVQVCDVAGVPRELMTDSDRVMPGDGDFRLAPLVARLKAINYAGAVSLELFNPTLWQVKVSQLAELGLGALERLLRAGAAEP